MLSQRHISATLSAFLAIVAAVPATGQETLTGERLDPTTYGPSFVESMQAAVERNRTAPPPENRNARDGKNGVWQVPSRSAMSKPHSGDRHVVNQWGDTRMAITFPALVDVQGAWFAGQADRGAWTTGLRALGYRDGLLVQETDWFGDISEEPAWFAMHLCGVDRLELLAVPVLNGGGWYAMDDLTYSFPVSDSALAEDRIVVDFDDLDYRAKLTGSTYAGLIWEAGAGEFTDAGVPSPRTRATASEEPAIEEAPPADPRGGATAPNLVTTFQGVLRGDATSMSYPPDTIGAVGPNHFVETVNRNFAVYDKATGAELVNILLGSFLPGSNGDPRVLFDQHSGRWIVLVTDFNATATIFLAVSLTDDATGAWFKTSFSTAQGADAGKWPDYPTLGVDANGIYTTAYMVGGANGMTIFAIDKAPLVAPTPSLGAITAFRSLPWEGAIQPAHTYGTPGGEYLVSTNGGSGIRIRRVNPPLTAPTLTEVGIVPVAAFSAPPNAPALGSSTALNTVDDRLMMAVYRDGSVWACHTISAGGRAACRWYQFGVAFTPPTLVQSGTVTHGSLHYFFPSIMVNAAGHVAMGFTGSNSLQYPGCYYTGRLASDLPGVMAVPVQYKPGTGAQNNVDSYGRNRWGDYSYTTLDPADQSTFWTIQEYGHANNIWGTYTAVLSTGPRPPAAVNGNVSSFWNAPVEIALQANDDGLPDPPAALTYAIVGLPAHGALLDPAAGPIQAVPYPLAGGNEVVYQPAEDYLGADGFQFLVDDGGTAPDGGYSNVANISINVVLPPPSPQYIFPLDEDPGWLREGQWAFGYPTGGGSHQGDPTGGFTGPNVFGYNLRGDYPNNLPEARYLTTAALDCSRFIHTELRFRRWLGVELAPADHATIEFSTNGVDWSILWQNGSASISDSTWQALTYDLGAVADGRREFRLRWGLGPTDSGVTYPGWNLDDVEIWAVARADRRGDLNCDGRTDLGDVPAFALALLDPVGYAAAYPSCQIGRADVNEDAAIDGRDVQDFAGLLLER